MRVGLLTTSFPRFEGDCSGSFVLEVARLLVAQGHEIRVLAPEPRRRRFAPSWPGIEVLWVPYARPRRLQNTFYGSGAPHKLRTRPTAWLGAAGFAAALFRAARHKLSDHDALVSHWCLPNGWIASTIAEGRPHLSICHATDVRWLSRMPGGGVMARRIMHGASRMWFLTPALRDRFLAVAGRRLEPRPIHIGPMPIEEPPPDTVSRLRSRVRLGLDRFTVLFLGRLVPIKGVDRLLHAAAAQPELLAIRIAGEGPERRKLQDLAARLGVDTRFEGWVSGEHKERLLRGCDALVVPSRAGEGIPTVIFEAMMRGLPVVASDVGGISEHIHDGRTGLLVPPEDRAALVHAIRDLAHDRLLGKTLATHALAHVERCKGAVPRF